LNYQVCISQFSKILFTLGFWHEQSRIDRDNYITVNLNNVQDGQQHNFNKYNTNQADTLGFNYDYYSIMHYDGRAFSKSIYFFNVFYKLWFKNKKMI